jgi:hypothetical protein
MRCSFCGKEDAGNAAICAECIFSCYQTMMDHGLKKLTQQNPGQHQEATS